MLEECLRCGAIKGALKGDNGESSPTAPSKRRAVLKAASQVSLSLMNVNLSSLSGLQTTIPYAMTIEDRKKSENRRRNQHLRVSALLSYRCIDWLPFETANSRGQLSHSYCGRRAVRLKTEA